MDSLDEQPEYIPLSYLNAYAYCPRRFYYEFTLGEMIVNEHVLAGRQFHERVDQPGSSTRGDRVQLRRVYVCAPRLGVAGYCDVVETTGEAAALPVLAAGGQLYPVEYKKGKLGQWLNDHVQLCAQALALEEALGVAEGSIVQGYVFYIGSARRDAVPIDATLRERTLATLDAARQVAVLSHPPPPITQWRKCRDCSLEPLCLPREVLGLQAGSLSEVVDGDPVSD